MTEQELVPVSEGLRIELGEARDALLAIVRGEADAIVVYGPAGEQVFTLRDAQQPYRVLVEAMNEGAATVAADGAILYANRALAEILDAPLETVIGASLCAWAAGDRAALEALLAAGLRAPVKRELTLANTSGRTVPVYLAASPTQLEGLPAVCLVVTDLSQQRRAERDILESITVAYCSFDREFRCTYANSEAERLFSRTRAQLLGRAPWDRPQLAGAELQARFRHAMEARQTVVFEHHAGGRWYEIKLCPASHGGLTESCRDISARKRAEQEVLDLNRELENRVRLRTAQLEAVNQELESFAYSVSHDLRAPLRAIRGFAGALAAEEGDRLEAPGRGYLHRITEGADRMNRLIQGLLDLCRTTRAPMHPESVALSDLVADLARDLQSAQPERRVEFSIASGASVRGDPTLIRDAMQNLLQNAWKFTARRPDARIEFGVRPGAEPVFFIRDNGAGFDMKYTDKLFVPFQRLHSLADFAGSGLGLAMVRRILARHGGRVWAEAAPGEGATFFFTLPDLPDVPRQT